MAVAVACLLHNKDNRRRNGENGGEAGSGGNGSDSSSLLVLFVAVSIRIDIDDICVCFYIYIYKLVVENRKKQVMMKKTTIEPRGR